METKSTLPFTSASLNRPKRTDRTWALTVVALIALFGIVAQPARAGFFGSAAVVEGHYPTLLSPGNPIVGPVTVGAGVEFPGFGGNNTPPFYSWTADVGDFTLALTEVAVGNNLGAATFNGFEFTFSGAPAIASVTLDPSSTLPITSLSFTANSIAINYAGQGILPANTTTLLDVTFVPEPGTLSLLFAAVFSGLLHRRWKRG
jgi:hypothetical protein